MRKIFKKLTASVMAMTTLAVCTVGMTASATTSATLTIDNDSIASGYGNNDVRSAYTYMTADSLYNGDARYTSSSNSNCDYYWSYPPLGSTNPKYFTIHIGAYLNHSRFTDDGAKYFVRYHPYTYKKVGTIDQNYAPGGWNYRSVSGVKSLNLVATGETAGYSSCDAYVEPSGSSGKYTGADGLKVWFTY